MIRRAVAGDAAALGDVLHDWLKATPWMPKLHSRAETHGFLAHLIATMDVLVAEEGVGFLAREQDHIRGLYLAPQARGRGIGAELLTEAKAARSRLSLWSFQANTGALASYLREGFREVERTDGDRNDEKLPDVRLEWSR